MLSGVPEGFVCSNITAGNHRCLNAGIAAIFHEKAYFSNESLVNRMFFKILIQFAT